MADQDTTVTAENGETIDEEVETLTGEDETNQEDNQEDQADTGTEDDESESEDDEQETDTETEDKDAIAFKKRFTQLKGETPEEYLKNLEDAYANSSTEGQRLAQRTKEAEQKFQQVAQLVATDPKFAKQLADATGEDAQKVIVDPALEFAREQMEERYKEDYAKFTDIHPEVAADKDIQQALVDELDAIGAAYEKRGVKLSLFDGLKKAWVSLGYDESDKKEDVVNKAKEQASKGTPKAKGTLAKKTQEFSADQIAVAKKMGLTPEQLAEYNK